MWGFKKKEKEKKEYKFTPTHLYLGYKPVSITGLCTDTSMEYIEEFSFGGKDYLRSCWGDKEYFQLIYKCSKNATS